MENMVNPSGKTELQGKCVGLITPVSALAVCAGECPVCVHMCAPCVRAQPQGPWARPWGSRAFPAGGGRVPVGATRGGARTRMAPALGVGTTAPFSAPLGTGSYREGGCRPSPSPFPQMPSAAGLLLQYRPRRLPAPWQLAALCSALAAFSLGSPPNRLLHLLICLKSHRTSRRRSPPGAGRPGRVCAPVLGGGAGRRAQPRAPLSPGRPGRSGGDPARGGRGAGARGARTLAARRRGPQLPIPAE